MLQQKKMTYINTKLTYVTFAEMNNPKDYS